MNIATGDTSSRIPTATLALTKEQAEQFLELCRRAAWLGARVVTIAHVLEQLETIAAADEGGHVLMTADQAKQLLSVVHRAAWIGARVVTMAPAIAALQELVPPAEPPRRRERSSDG